MAYQVIARKWRPQTFNEIVFQDHVSKTIINSIVKKRISHAYIFSGPRGVGKTTMARVLAKSLNCVEGPTDTPCNICANCTEITLGTSFDVIEIDGASNRGIEDIRELRENVNFAPVKSAYKVYIIDEIHMLTAAAFNALLKTLEEPPPHIVFIFATTEIHQIPDTILSRCQKFFFKKIPIESIVNHLRHIVSEEGYNISDKALFPIARSAGGSMRDAQSLLDQVISFSAGNVSDVLEISEDDALSILGIVPIESFLLQLKHIADANAKGVIEEINRIISVGVDITRYTAGFIDIIRSLRLIKNKINVAEVLALSKEEMETLSDIVTNYSDEELSHMYKISKDLESDFKHTNNERINFEMAILDMISVKKTPSLSAIIKKLDQAPSSIVSQETGPITKENQSNGIKNEYDNYSKEVNQSIQENENKTLKKKLTTDIKDDFSAAPEEKIKKVWSDFLIYINEHKQYLHFILKPASVQLKGKELHLSYPGGTDHSYHKKILDSKNLNFIRQELAKRLKFEVSIIIGVTDPPKKIDFSDEVKEKSKTVKKVENLPPEEVPLPENEMMKQPEIVDMKQTDPTISKIKQLFHGEIVKKGDK